MNAIQSLTATAGRILMIVALGAGPLSIDSRNTG